MIASRYIKTLYNTSPPSQQAVSQANPGFATTEKSLAWRSVRPGVEGLLQKASVPGRKSLAG
jgi:hypothetical protein